MECHTTLERVARRAKVKCTKDSDSNPGMVSRDVLEDTAIGVGELATKMRSVVLNERTQRTIHHKARCKETFVNEQTQLRNGKVTTSPKEKEKGKGKTLEKGNHNPNQTGSPDEETGQRTLSDFALKRQRVRLVYDDDFEVPREDQANYVLCSQLRKRHERISGCAKLVTNFRRASD